MMDRGETGRAASWEDDEVTRSWQTPPAIFTRSAFQDVSVTPCVILFFHPPPSIQELFLSFPMSPITIEACVPTYQSSQQPGPHT